MQEQTFPSKQDEEDETPLITNDIAVRSFVNMCLTIILLWNQNFLKKKTFFRNFLCVKSGLIQIQRVKKLRNAILFFFEQQMIHTEQCCRITIFYCLILTINKIIIRFPIVICSKWEVSMRFTAKITAECQTRAVSSL